MEERLTAELKCARERLQHAKEEFDLANSSAREIGLDHPDGIQLALQASQRYNEVVKAYRLALKRFCNFILRGEILPEEEPTKGY
jgi:hypothetical protein